MKDLQELVLTIVSPLVTKPEDIKLELVESDDFLEYNLTVAPEDIGRIIGNKVGLPKQFERSFTVYGQMDRKSSFEYHWW